MSPTSLSAGCVRGPRRECQGGAAGGRHWGVLGIRAPSDGFMLLVQNPAQPVPLKLGGRGLSHWGKAAPPPPQHLCPFTSVIEAFAHESRGSWRRASTKPCWVAQSAFNRASPDNPASARASPTAGRKAQLVRAPVIGRGSSSSGTPRELAVTQPPEGRHPVTPVLVGVGKRGRALLRCCVCPCVYGSKGLVASLEPLLESSTDWGSS